MAAEGSCLDEVAAAANSNNISLNGGENNISGSKLQSTIASECPYEGCCSGTESIDSSAKSSVGAEPCKVVCCELYNPDYASLNGTCCCGAKLDPNESVIVNDALKSRSSALQDNLSSNNTNVTKRMPSAARPTEVLSSEAPIDMTHRFPSIDSSSNKKISSPPHSIDDSINMSSSNAMCTISDDTSALTAYKEHLEDLSGMEVHNAIPSSLRNAREELMQAALPKDVIKQVTDATKSVASTFQYTLIPTSHEMHSKAMNKTAEIPCAKIEPCLASSSAVEPPCARIEPCTKSATVESLKLVEPPCAAIAPCNIIPTSKPMEVTVKLEPRSIPSVAEHVKEKSLLTSKPTDVLGVKTEPSTTPSVAERVEVACVKMEPCMKPSIAEPVLNMPLLASKPTEVPCVKMDPCPTPQVVKEEPLSTPKPTEIPCVKMDPCPTPQVVKEKPLSTPKLTEVPCVKMDPCPMSSIAEPVKEMPLSKPAEVPCAKFDPCIAVAPPVEPSCVKMDACLNAPKMNEAGDSASNSSKSSLMANNSNHANCAKIDDRSKPPNNTESCVKIEACVAPPSNASAGCSSGGGNNHPNTMANSDPQATKPCCSQCKLACGTPCSSPAGSYSLPDQPVFSGSAYSGPAPPPPPKATCVSGPGHPYCGSPPSKQQGGCGPLPPAPPPSQQPPPHRPHHHRTCHKMANASQQAPVLTRSAVLGSLRSGCINFVRIGGISGFLAVAISAYAAHAFAKGGGGGGGEEKDEEQDEGGTRASSRQGTASRQSTGSPKSQEGDEGDEDDEGGNGKEYSDSDKQIFYTANLFHFVHSLALLATPVFKCPNLTGLLMTTGMVMFCGSCYLRVFTGNKDVTALTPYGGVLLLISWLTMVF